MMTKKVAWFLFFALLAGSCLDDPDCYNLNNNVVGISFRKMADNKADTLALLGISITGTDSVFYGYRLVTGINLPVNFLSSQSDISFLTLNGNELITRQLSLGYRSQIQFVSEDCGERYIISDLKALGSDFDSVRIVDGSPGTTPFTNVIVYRCPETNKARLRFRQWYADDDSLGHPLNLFVDGITTDFSPTVFYANDTANSFILPLNLEANETQINFDFVEGSNTITLGYRTSDRTVLHECGTQRFLDSLVILATDFESARIANDSVQDPPQTNVMFFRCPDTNLVKLAFKGSADETAPNITVPVVGITADYTSEVFYPNAEVSTVTLPLNEAADATRFSIEFEGGPVDITLGYSRTQAVYHEVCNQTVMSSLEVISSGFNSPPRLVEEEISFPPDLTNVAIVVN